MTTSTFVVEADLVSGLRAGDDEAAACFVRQYTGKLLAVARRFLRNEDDAADAVQEAFLSAFKSLEQFEGISTLGTWMHRILVNTCLMKLRALARRKTRSIDELLPSFDGTGHHTEPVCSWPETAFEQMASEEARMKVRTCIDQLPDDYRSILLLRDIEEFDTEQTAAILGLNPGAAKTRLHRARQALRKLLEPYMGDTLAQAI
jgi:RNA polymerase sigma-70 factor (ECF subfamily)